MKVVNSYENITPFGGLNFVNSTIERLGLADLLDTELGVRAPQAIYAYSDVIKTLWYNTLCGGDCAEDVTEHLRDQLLSIPGVKVPSADVLLGVQKQLATEKQVFISDAGITHEFNTNEKLNRTNIRMLKRLGMLKEGERYDFDYDNQFQPTGKYDAKMSYKKKEGYFPGVASIGDMPVYIENRNGNSNVKFKQAETLTRTYGLLKEEGIHIRRSRMDCGSFSKVIIEVVEANSELFYIRAQRCDDLKEQISAIDPKEWNEVEIGNKKYQAATLWYAPFGAEKKYRYVVAREKNKTGQADIFTKDDFTYRAIITDDKEMTDKQVIEYYNDRGESEVLFDVMNNDFNWNKLPFSFLNENTVYLIIMAMCKNLYTYLIKTYSEKLDFLEPSWRLKKFIFRFMALPCKWITRGRQKILKIFTHKPYHLVLE